MWPKDFELKEIKALMLPDPRKAFEMSNVVLSVQPHPDDVDIAAGGTIAKLVSRECHVI